jgi:tetratricopeptide (TPR) repeat protein
LCEGNRDEAAAQMREAVRADPLSPIVSNFAALAYLCLGQADEAIAEGKRTLQLDPNYLYEFPILAEAYRNKGMFAEAIDVYKKAQEATGVPQRGLGVTYARMGRMSDARQVLADLKKVAEKRYIPSEDVASVCVAVGDIEEAFTWLDRACQEHSGPLHAIAVREDFTPLHSDPRFAAILKRIGLDPIKVLASAKTP